MSASANYPAVKLTYHDYVLISDDGQRHKIVDGPRHINASPNLLHQAVSRHIQF